MIGAEYVAKSPADGYTLIMGTISSHAINMSYYFQTSEHGPLIQTT